MRENVLVLNQDYQALSICSVERAFILLFLKKADLIDELPGKTLRSVGRAFKYPSVIRLNKYARVPYRQVSLTRANIFRRDKHTCAYCGARTDLTIDHILPRSIGGRESWENLITACQSCNAKKGNQTPEQSGMKLRFQPFRPSFVMYLNNSASYQDTWRPYLYS